jgi:ABC-2 type transport system permease protein
VHKIWAVVRREFLERVRTKWFIISTVLGPVFMIGITVLPALLASRGGGPRAVAVVDEGSGAFASRLVTQLGTGNRFVATRVSAEGPRASEVLDSLTRTVQAKTLEGFL